MEPLTDLHKIKRNIAKMIDEGAPESDVDDYIASEGVTLDQVKSTPMQPRQDGAESPLAQRGIFVPGGIREDGSFDPYVLPEIINAPWQAISGYFNDPTAIDRLRRNELNERDFAAAAEGGLLGVGSTFKQLPSMARQAARAGAPQLGDSVVRTPQPRQGPPRGTPTGRQMATDRAAEATQDLEAMARQGVRPLPPAFADGPVASVSKQLSETPLIGAPIRENIDETFTDAARAVGRVADEISPRVTQETAGRTTQNALERFSTATLDELEPGVVDELQIPPSRPVQMGAAGGAQQMQRLAAQQDTIQGITGGRTETSRGVPAFSQARTLSERLTQRTRPEDLSDAQLERVIRAPSQDTSFATRAEALYERAFRRLGNVFRRDGTADSSTFSTSNTGRVMREIADTAKRTGINRNVASRYGDLQEMMTNNRRNQTIDTMRRIRTEIGRDLQNYGQYEQSLDRQQLRAIYGALSDDIAIAMQETAARLAQRAAQGQDIPPEQIRLSAQAVRDLQIADRFFRMGQRQVEDVRGLMQQQNPQRVVADVVRWATEGDTGNMKTVRKVLRIMRPEERDEVAALVVRRVFEPKPGARGIVEESGFSAESALTNWSKMSNEAKRMLFPNQAHRQSIEDLIRIAGRISNVERQTNFSRSGTNALNIGGATGAIAYGASGDVFTPALIAGSGAGLSYLMSRPYTAAWLVRFMRLRARVRAGSAQNADLVRAQMSMVRKLAKRSENDPRALLIADALRSDVEQEAASYEGISNTIQNSQYGGA